MFKIQISNPKVLQISSEETLSLEEAIELIFPLDNEYSILIWNNIFVPLSYKYDVSLMVLDFIKIVDFIRSRENNLNIYWASNTFAAVWKLQKIDDMIQINSKWDNTIGSTEDLLNKSNLNIISAKELEKEIKKIIAFLRKSLQKSGINCNKIEGFEFL